MWGNLKSCYLYARIYKLKCSVTKIHVKFDLSQQKYYIHALLIYYFTDKIKLNVFIKQAKQTTLYSTKI